MKELRYAMLAAAFLLGGCQHQDFYYEESSLAAEASVETKAPEEKVTATAIPVKDPSAAKEETAAPAAEETPAPAEENAAQKDDEIEVMHPDEPVEELVYDSAYDRFLNNVVIKSRSENHVTYEYKDVRVDELAPLASRYCQENGNRTAVLRSVILYKNFARRATFDCLRLQ